MDRLVKPDVKEVNLTFTRGQKCSATFRLTNLMHTMSVAVSLTTTDPSLFSFGHPFSILPPLSTSSFTLLLSQPSDHPPLSTIPDTILVRSSMLPTGKAHQDDLRRLFSKPGSHVFKDATIPISFVGPDVVEALLSPSKTLEIAFLLSKAIAWCDESQLTSLLISASMNGNSYIASALIEAGAELNSRDSDGQSLLSLAIRSGDIDVLQLLIESGCTIDNSIDLFLHDAAAMDRVDLIEVLCLGFGDNIDVNSIDSCGRTALHVAAIRGHVDVLRFLVSMGGDPDVADCNGWTPLHCASAEGQGEAVEFLLTKCSTYVKYALTKDGKTAFAVAVDKGHSHLYDMLHLGDLLHRAARIDDVHGMKNSLAEGAKVNSRDQNGWTPLHRAAFKGRIESVKLLLNHGAQVDLVDDAGYTPLHRAVEAGHVQVALCLIAHGARTNVKNLKGEQGLTPAQFKGLGRPRPTFASHSGQPKPNSIALALYPSISNGYPSTGNDVVALKNLFKIRGK
ncbi:hypothetical protein F0562_021324 [Nyssa sinensis]|uniref:MSP domain-containing protein n=1 Tax=Nyssa sinensis TaxID=561372 RepID=A0A5J5BPR8_9ASTE|nr:hypothetical protein F0562_021324 [Nyssa sinensis]